MKNLKNLRVLDVFFGNFEINFFMSNNFFKFFF